MIQEGSIKIVYKQGIDFSNPKFWDEKGWGREPLSKTLNCTEFGATFFPAADHNLCLTAYHDTTPVGYVATNLYSVFYRNVQHSIQQHKQDGVPENIAKFINVISWAVKEGENKYYSLIEQYGWEEDLISHSCGLMVIDDYANKGIGSELYRRRSEMLKSKGKKALILETTNKFSANAIKKDSRFVIVASKNYKEFGIDLDDCYTVWCGIL